MPSLRSWRPSARLAFIRALTVHTAACRAPGRDGCGMRVHTIPVSLATSIAATRSWTRSCSWSPGYQRSAHRGHLLGLASGIRRAARGSRSAGTRPGILTGVLEATVRDPQVKTPAARLNYGFASHSVPASRAARPYCPPPRTTAQTPARTRQRTQPAATGTDPDFHAARPSPDEMAKLAQLGQALETINGTH